LNGGQWLQSEDARVALFVTVASHAPMSANNAHAWLSAARPRARTCETSALYVHLPARLHSSSRSCCIQAAAALVRARRGLHAMRLRA
jgi:hypothetical protein